MHGMIYDRRECEAKFSMPGKLNVIVPTFNQPVTALMWSVMSLLLRSTGDFLEHINVVINGPDDRNNYDASNQNQKQAFLEDLRRLKWNERDMPLTVIRIWSRIGIGRAVDAAVPWVHTDCYAYLHDDSLWLSHGWEAEAKEVMARPRVALAYPRDYGVCKTATAVIHGEGEFGIKNRRYMIDMPFIGSPFILCHKSRLANTSASWGEYYIAEELNLGSDGTAKLQKAHGTAYHPVPEKQYHMTSHRPGSWILHEARRKGFKVARLKQTKVLHLMLSSNFHLRKNRWVEFSEAVKELEEGIKSQPGWWEVYEKYHKDDPR